MGQGWRGHRGADGIIYLLNMLSWAGVEGTLGCRWNNLLVKHAQWGRGGGDIGVQMECCTMNPAICLPSQSRPNQVCVWMVYACVEGGGGGEDGRRPRRNPVTDRSS